MKQLTLVPEGGLCNRIYAITSTVDFAKKNNMQLTIIWFKDWGMGAGFHDLFTLSPSVKNVEIKDASFVDFFKYAKPIKRNFFLPKLYQRLKFDTTYFWYKEQVSVEKWYYSKENNVNKIYLFHCSGFYDNCNMLNVFSPINSIQERIEKQLNLLSPHTIGVHIRRTDFITLKRHTPISAFIERMQQEIATNPKVNFYVASDSPEEKEKLVNLFGNRIITIENNLKRNSKIGIIDALIELYILASTKKIFGSNRSSYSLIASEIKGIPLEIITEIKN